ncbi:MAG TPA: hypothetical protein PK971_13340, partial [Saprospiraceae bacterium]|nr:hypothetical protein [Saprospiraceae bacterium]
MAQKDGKTARLRMARLQNSSLLGGCPDFFQKIFLRQRLDFQEIDFFRKLSLGQYSAKIGSM